MQLTYLKCKDAEKELQKKFDSVAVRIEPLDRADILYTDGEVSNSACKLIIGNGLYTVYLPQLIYVVDPDHRLIIEEWLQYVKSRG